jgi:hypothetical protein
MESTDVKKISKKALYKKIQFFAKEITDKRPSFETVFRQYYDSLKLISEILSLMNENPWHPENDNAFSIFWDINENLAELEKIRLQATA